jgi:hypothetical protein
MTNTADTELPPERVREIDALDLDPWRRGILENVLANWPQLPVKEAVAHLESAGW